MVPPNKIRGVALVGKNDAILSVQDLYIKESRQLGDEVDTKSVSVVTGTAGEPWVAFTPKDRFGLALSGGGIRSATFNLGLLQALAQLGVLRQVNYCPLCPAVDTSADSGRPGCGDGATAPVKSGFPRQRPARG